jgi:pimeloyl-ACP methyl ester carboxylesterase
MPENRLMRFISKTSLDGVTEQLFTLDEIPGVLWTPEDADGTRPLILMGHGGGQHKKAPAILARARRFAADGGFAVASIDVPNHGERPTDEAFDRIATEYRARAAAGEDTAALDTAMYTLVVGQTVAEWQAVLTAVQQTRARAPSPSSRPHPRRRRGELNRDPGRPPGSAGSCTCPRSRSG